MLSAIAVLIATVALCVIMVGLFGWGPPRDGRGVMRQRIIRVLLVVGGLFALMVAAVLFGAARPAFARDLGQWGGQDPDLRAWYESLMQPDVPTASCCGVADAYFCDDYRLHGGKAVCTISDDRPDGPRGRPHIDIGTVIEIPPYKLKWDAGNPTGHGIIFLSRNRYVFCYVQPGGV
ncbi:hypothetical protein [Bradyrhizobium sp. SRS-191]|uniref:hypothetical protein n=1 Tax=Bradyrhizobium sp. SRS-191 TaxID=2962606 RepID=UPI00211E5C43|nr:hypothetical protein [Bradyrhizobium sp. SRS-191]